MNLMTTFGQGKLSRSFTIGYLLVDAATSDFGLVSRKTFNELGAIVSMPNEIPYTDRGDGRLTKSNHTNVM